MSTPDTFSTALARLAAERGPSVVGLGHGWEVGSGFVCGPNEVLAPAWTLGEEPTVVYGDGRRAGAEVTGVDQGRGLALLAVDTADAAPLAWRPAEDPVAIGTPVIALADPGGRGLRGTPGYVTSLPRAFRGPRGRRVLAGIEHTAPLPRGSAGSPLLDLDGRLVGINAVRASGGLILAVPADATLAAALDALRSGRPAPSRQLGVAVVPPRLARRLRRSVGLPERDGALVRAVEDDSPAARAGIERGDLIAVAAGRTVDHVDVLHDALETLPVGTPLALTVVRGTDERELAVAFP